MKKIWLKRIVAVLCIIGVTFALEAWFNRRALLHGYKDRNLRKKIVFEEKEGSKSGVYKVKLDKLKNVFVHELIVSTEEGAAGSYSLVYTYIDPYGNEKTETKTDTVQEWFRLQCSYIDKYLKSLEITIYGLEEGELQTVLLTNRVEWNKFRMLFFLIMGLLIYLGLFEKCFRQHPERFFAVFALSLGSLIILAVGIKKVSWDEQEHFKQLYQTAQGRHVQWTEAVYDFGSSVSATCNTKTEFKELRQYMNDPQRQQIVAEDYREAPYLTYEKFGYLPSIIFIKAGQMLRLPFELLFYAGKFGNLLSYIIILYFAILAANRGKMFLLLLSMSPTLLFQAASYTYDTIVFSMITIGIVLLFREVGVVEENINREAMILSVICIVLGSLSKAVYIPLILLWLIPIFTNRRLSGKDRARITCCIILAFAIVMFTFVMPAISNTVSGNMSFGGDKRGGDTGMVRQIYSMLGHPLHTIKMFITQMLKFDNFRNLGTTAADKHFFVNLMFLNMGTLGILPEKWSILFIIAVVLTMFVSTDQVKRIPAGWTVFAFVIVLGTVTLIWMAMYLSFTPVGTDAIYGVQARYYLPLLLVIFSLIPRRRSTGLFTYESIWFIVSMVSCLLTGKAVFELVLRNRLF